MNIDQLLGLIEPSNNPHLDNSISQCLAYFRGELSAFRKVVPNTNKKNQISKEVSQRKRSCQRVHKDKVKQTETQKHKPVTLSADSISTNSSSETLTSLDSRLDRRPRTTFTIEQANYLELEYAKSEYISRTERIRLAGSLDLNEGQIKIWFQNRRAKDKRIEKARYDRGIRYLTNWSTEMDVTEAEADVSEEEPTDKDEEGMD